LSTIGEVEYNFCPERISVAVFPERVKMRGIGAKISKLFPLCPSAPLPLCCLNSKCLTRHDISSFFGGFLVAMS